MKVLPSIISRSSDCCLFSISISDLYLSDIFSSISRLGFIAFMLEVSPRCLVILAYPFITIRMRHQKRSGAPKCGWMRLTKREPRSRVMGWPWTAHICRPFFWGGSFFSGKGLPVLCLKKMRDGSLALALGPGWEEQG